MPIPRPGAIRAVVRGTSVKNRQSMCVELSNSALCRPGDMRLGSNVGIRMTAKPGGNGLPACPRRGPRSATPSAIPTATSHAATGNLQDGFHWAGHRHVNPVQRIRVPMTSTRFRGRWHLVASGQRGSDHPFWRANRTTIVAARTPIVTFLQHRIVTRISYRIFWAKTTAIALQPTNHTDSVPKLALPFHLPGDRGDTAADAKGFGVGSSNPNRAWWKCP